ncbi:MAG: glycosyltransferase family 2 protein [Bacteroidia bacterium]|nr:glycosyltransferase family 2 protein [Bacteroidia bacterium]MBT8276146.1 glycosyltransferase family 2 protein [Bacteroidia bacterium]NNF32444.1 glycosyltransferase family 2 protein [Flavobacteriaceae bacterium]NNK71493.1 glycosyltransferase family 2 protein [Flavobacteriaceae bacterium]NNM08989.1 glycosyltransferase family 2 protein [Flavobacteriaceae bacterium]
MRIGQNPNISKELDLSKSSHRVIIPVYIPNAEGYFEGSFNVLKMCIQSLLATINSDTKISLISNASSDEVNTYIRGLFEAGKIDRAVFNTDNVGKMNAIIPEARASFEDFVTYADADVFFDKGWLKQTFSMFEKVRNAGLVSMNPTPRNLARADSTVLDNIFTFLGAMKKTKDVCSYDDLRHFHKSVDRDLSFTEKMFHQSKVACVGENYIIGAGHFCCTVVRTQVLRKTPLAMSNIAASGGSENIYLDTPMDKTGLWRLSSPKAFVWHMGNALDKEWASQKLKSLENFSEEDFRFADLPSRRRSLFSRLIPYSIKTRLVALFKKIKWV